MIEARRRAGGPRPCIWMPPLRLAVSPSSCWRAQLCRVFRSLILSRVRLTALQNVELPMLFAGVAPADYGEATLYAESIASCR